MILLYTHVWIWLVHDDSLLPATLRASIELDPTRNLAVSAISCWEVAKLAERGRLELPMESDAWMDLALEASGIHLLPLTPQICVASTTLPGTFHRDPADQLIVATSRVLGVPLATCDSKIRSYPHVSLLEDSQIHDR